MDYLQSLNIIPFCCWSSRTGIQIWESFRLSVQHVLSLTRPETFLSCVFRSLWCHAASWPLFRWTFRENRRVVNNWICFKFVLIAKRLCTGRTKDIVFALYRLSTKSFVRQQMYQWPNASLPCTNDEIFHHLFEMSREIWDFFSTSFLQNRRLKDCFRSRCCVQVQQTCTQ